MSLIQEALKRQHEDNGQDSQEIEKAPPAQEANEQAPSSESQENPAPEENRSTVEEPEESSARNKAPPQKKGKKNRFVPAAIITVLVIVATAATAYFLLFAHGKDSDTKQFETDITETALNPEEQTASAPYTPDETGKAGEQAQEAENQKPEEVIQSTGKNTPEKEIDKEMRKPAPSAAKPEKEPRPEPVLWPKLTLQGLLSKGREGGAALINNELIQQGGQIKGVELVEVRKSSVVLKYKGEAMELKARESTR